MTIKKHKNVAVPMTHRARNAELVVNALSNLGMKPPASFDPDKLPNNRRAENGLEALAMLRVTHGLEDDVLTASMRQVRAHVTAALRTGDILDGEPDHGGIRFRYRMDEQEFPLIWQRKFALSFEDFLPLTVNDAMPMAAIEAIRVRATAEIERHRDSCLQIAYRIRAAFDLRFQQRAVFPIENRAVGPGAMSDADIELLLDQYIEMNHSSEHAAEERRRMAIEDPRLLHLDVPVAPRRVLALLGPTNSGKTHEGLNQLCDAGNGAYLGPLRLMALENHEALLNRGVKCSLLTGEEEITDPDDTHVSATVEMFNQARHWGTVLIDEIQMLADPDRGWAWSRAFLSASTDLLIVAGSPDAEPLIRRLAEMNGDTIEVRRFERRNALDVSPAKVGWDELRSGDAIIAFSRDDVLGFKALAESRGFNAAAVYGALGPEARHEQARRFRDGEVDILVATDAIGMGLNLPIDRVLFTRITKWDGREERSLTGSETRQVAGRAGRFSSRRAGIVALMHGAGKADRLEKLMNAPSSIDIEAPLPMQPGWAVVSRIINERNLTLENALSLIADALLGHPDASYTMTDDVIDILQLVNGAKHSAQQRFHHMGLPLTLRTQGNRNTLISWIRQVNEGRAVTAPTLDGLKPGPSADTYELRRIENVVQQAGAYMWLARRFALRYPHAEQARATRVLGTEYITTILSQKALARPCNSCKKPLPPGHRIPVCDPCHKSRWHDDY